MMNFTIIVKRQNFEKTRRFKMPEYILPTLGINVGIYVATFHLSTLSNVMLDYIEMLLSIVKYKKNVLTC